MSAAPQLEIRALEIAPRRAPEGGFKREWRHASRTVRLSAACLALFYLFALASPFFASYDPGYQNRAMPDCPPMALHLNAPSDWSRGFLYVHPMTMVDPIERRFAADPLRRVYVHLFSHGHLFTTDSPTEPYYMLGSDGLGRDLWSRIVYGSRVSMCVGLIGVAISFSLGITVGASTT
jgi:peptide/nickel transport system permease protein